MIITLTYFLNGYFFPNIVPNIITGTGLQDLNNTCTGYITYLNDLTDVNVDAIDVNDNISILYFDISVGFSLNIFLAKNAVNAYIVVVTNKNEISCNCRYIKCKWV